MGSRDAVTSQPSRTGLAVSAVGDIVTAIAVYQPWYGIGITPAGASAAQQGISSLPGASAYAGTIGAAASAAVGRTVFSVTAHQALHQISIVLLIVAAAAILVSIVGLAGSEPSFAGSSASGVAGLGVIGALLTIFRMVDHLSDPLGYFTVSVRFGAFLSLLGCAAIVAGAVWPTPADGEAADDPAPSGEAWSQMSGWTPS
jgi:hypothetical protein